MSTCAPVRTPSAARTWLRALELTAPIARNPHRILSDVIEEWAAKTPDAPALLSGRRSMTYADLAGYANRCARWALAQGLRQGDSVCLIAPNSPEYLATWLGIARTGCTVALVNTNLTGPSLDHCVGIVDPKHVIAGSELEGQLNAFSPEPLRASERRPITIRDRALCIYTSGTTGLPKAANISHARLMQWSHWFAGLLGTTPNDRLYNCLPMYHSVGGIVATGAVLAAGGSVVIRESFSASQFWKDVVQWDCTLFQYIGELCRYLLHGAPAVEEARHRIRICCGNGLRPDIWDQFQTRFRIPQILEFYASTEGNVSLFNVEGKPGSIGRIPSYLSHRFPVTLIQTDPGTQAPRRDDQGLCIAAGAGETGEAVGRIDDDGSHPGNTFEGYVNKADSEKKILRDVFQRGDAWFRTGDLMRRDEQGFFYFVDRVGDTFRWKGENVSTMEVAEAICSFSSVRQAVVYGVSLPGADGRPGMALISPQGAFDLAAFRAHLCQRLPEYAHPVFLRLCDDPEVTATFKYAKAELVREGYDPSATSDALYVSDRRLQLYVPLEQAVYERIQTGGMRL